MSRTSIPFTDIADADELWLLKIAPDTELPADPIDYQSDRWAWAITQAMRSRPRRRLDKVWEGLQSWSWMVDPWATLVFSVVRWDGVFGLQLPMPETYDHGTIVFYRRAWWHRDVRGVLMPAPFDVNWPDFPVGD
jgi:hypothetical protein